MKWQKLPNGDYQAQGENGDFLIWKSCGVYKCRYRSKDKKKAFFSAGKEKIERGKNTSDGKLLLGG